MSLASKHFDPVLGIDIHFVQPPAPGPPVPIPHPFVGMILDPFDYLPFIGASVFVNGLPAATAGTQVMATPPHFPIGGTFVPPLPGNEGEVFMGSTTVLFQGFPATYTGLPVLTCQSIGIVTPFRPGTKKKKLRSLVLPTSMVLAIPTGSPVAIGGAPTISLLALGMRAAFRGLTRGLRKLRAMQKASKRWKRISRRLQARADRIFHGASKQARNRVKRSICTVTGHPVDIATGKVFTESTDFILPGPIPLEWTRVWYSTSGTSGPIGHGWHHSLDLELVEEEGIVAVRLADGRAIGFMPPGPDEASLHEEGFLLQRTPDGRYELADEEGLRYQFARRTGGEKRFALMEVGDAWGNRIRLEYDREPRPVRIIDSAGRLLTVERDAKGRILDIRTAHPDRTSADVTLVSYRYDDLGNLERASLTEGSNLRYGYDRHLLVTEVGPEGLVFHFEYEGEGTDAWCTRTWGEGGILERSLRYDHDARSTRVRDSRGHEVRHDWNADGTLAFPEGEEPDGPSSEDADDDSEETITLDDRGLVVSYENDLEGLVEFTYDEDGNISSRREGRLLREYRCDDWGREVWRRDPDGLEVHSTWDLAGRLVREDRGAEGIIDLAWDRADRIDSLKVDGQLITGVRYKGLEWEEGYRFADWSTFYLIRDGEGDLAALVNERGEWARIDRAPDGGVTGVTDFDGSSFAIHTDMRGRRVRVEQADGSSVVLEKTREGRVASVEGSDGSWASFTWDQGRLAEARNDAITLQYASGDGWVEEVSVPSSAEEEERSWVRAFDAFGRPVWQRSPAGREASFTWTMEGRLAAVEFADGEAIAFEHDEAGRELERRFPGGLVRKGEHIGVDDVRETLRDAAGGLVLERTRDIDRLGNVRWVEEPGRGRRSWDYDLRDRLIREEGFDGSVRTFDYDVTGNLLSHPDFGSMRYEAGDRLVEADRGWWRHDEMGRVIRAKLGQGAEEALSWDAFGRLRSWETVGGGRTEYLYDPFGRRIEKRLPDGGVHRYEYDALSLVSERRDGVEFEYLRCRGMVENLALWRDGEPAWILSDHTGAPMEVVSPAGKVLWSGRYTGLGAFETEGELDFRLRLPGQLFDAESGLHYNLLRTFDPRVGRYLSRDPLRVPGHGHPYALGPSLLNYVDPTGAAAEKTVLLTSLSIGERVFVRWVFTVLMSGMIVDAVLPSHVFKTPSPIEWVHDSTIRNAPVESPTPIRPSIPGKWAGIRQLIRDRDGTLRIPKQKISTRYPSTSSMKHITRAHDAKAMRAVKNGRKPKGRGSDARGRRSFRC